MLRDKQSKKNSGQRLPVLPAWVYERPALLGDFLPGTGGSADTAVPIGRWRADFRRQEPHRSLSARRPQSWQAGLMLSQASAALGVPRAAVPHVPSLITSGWRHGSFRAALCWLRESVCPGAPADLGVVLLNRIAGTAGAAAGCRAPNHTGLLVSRSEDHGAFGDAVCVLSRASHLASPPLVKEPCHPSCSQRSRERRRCGALRLPRFLCTAPAMWPLEELAPRKSSRGQRLQNLVPGTMSKDEKQGGGGAPGSTGGRGHVGGLMLQAWGRRSGGLLGWQVPQAPRVANRKQRSFSALPRDSVDVGCVWSLEELSSRPCVRPTRNCRGGPASEEAARSWLSRAGCAHRQQTWRVPIWALPLGRVPRTPRVGLAGGSFCGRLAQRRSRELG